MSAFKPPPELLRFLSENTTRDSSRTTSSEAIYDAYKQWCYLNKEKPTTRRHIGLWLGNYGYIRHRMASSRRWGWTGLSLERPVAPDVELLERAATTHLTIEIARALTLPDGFPATLKKFYETAAEHATQTAQLRVQLKAALREIDRLRSLLPTAPEPEHGTVARYDSGCRCEPCGDAALDDIEARRLQHVASLSAPS